MATASASCRSPAAARGAFAAGVPSAAGSSHASVYTRPFTRRRSAGSRAGAARTVSASAAAKGIMPPPGKAAHSSLPARLRPDEVRRDFYTVADGRGRALPSRPRAGLSEAEAYCEGEGPRDLVVGGFDGPAEIRAQLVVDTLHRRLRERVERPQRAGRVLVGRGENRLVARAVLGGLVEEVVHDDAKEELPLLVDAVRVVDGEVGGRHRLRVEGPPAAEVVA